MRNNILYNLFGAFCILALLPFQSTYGKSPAPSAADSIRHSQKLSSQEINNSPLISKNHPYQLSVSYKYDRFNKTFSPWSEWSVYLEHKNSWGTVIGRLNDASRFSHNAAQVELDAYPIFRKGTYAYLNAGFSQGAIYPDYRFGASVYQAVPGHFVLGAGLRSMIFPSQNVFILTGTISKYITHYYIALHPYIDPNKKNQSIMFLMRRYLSNPRNYIQIMMGAGSTPFGFNTNQDLTRLNSKNIQLLLQKELTSSISLLTALGMEREEYRPQSYRNRYHVEIALSYRF